MTSNNKRYCYYESSESLHITDNFHIISKQSHFSIGGSILGCDNKTCPLLLVENFPNCLFLTTSVPVFFSNNFSSGLNVDTTKMEESRKCILFWGTHWVGLNIGSQYIKWKGQTIFLSNIRQSGNTEILTDIEIWELNI